MEVRSDLIDISNSYDMMFKFQTQSLNASTVLKLPNEDSSMFPPSTPWP